MSKTPYLHRGGRRRGPQGRNWLALAVGLGVVETRARLREEKGGWVVRWRDSLVHPRLDPSSRLGTTRVPAERGEILGRGGRALVTGRPVVRVGAVAGEVDDPERTAGERVKLALPVGQAQVPPGRNEVERAAAMIGQHRILATPLAMAGVAGTVAEGRWRAPRLLASDASDSARAPDESTVNSLRRLMRSVVTSGTGVALAPVPGEVHGKSGTAEYGGGDPPPTHAWFIAYRGDLAFSVLVENGRSGGSVAAPIAARFFDALGQPASGP